jgi:DtxR family Mn-dependent transcriptional regulator
MAQALGNPRVDPHGDPIPGPDGSIAEFIHVPLVDVAVGETVTIRRIATQDDERLRYLGTSGLKPGQTVTVVDRQPFSGPLTVRLGDDERVVAHEMGMILLCARDRG